jgi:long-subunit acyl-CoA synthetase (AMP-forming)
MWACGKGMTETSPVTFMSETDDPVIKRTDTVGRVHPHVRAKVVDPADPECKPLPVNEEGELLVAGCKRHST